MERPDTQYVWSGDYSIAYQVVGDGPNLIYLPQFASNVYWNWEMAEHARFMRRLASTVKDLVAGSGFRFEDRGAHSLKGVPDQWRLYAVARD